ncbi:hypothetical protein [Methylobacterium fujisawaense]
MPSFRNTAVDPQQISGAFDSIAKAFQTTPQEILAGAKSRETLQKVQYLADAYKLAADPSSDQGQLDRIASIAGAYAPSQSLTAVDRNNATTLKTNAADNSRALQTNTADNQNKIALKLMDPLSADQTGYTPPSIASVFGVPEVRRGIVKVNEGQNAVLPDGSTIAGRDKPLTEDNVKARVLAGMDPKLQQAAAFGNTPVESVQTPGGPRIATRLDAVGQAPAPDAQKAQFFNYDTPDGKSGTAHTTPDGKLVDSQTGAELPAGSRTYTAQLTGNKTDTGLGASLKSSLETQANDLSNLELSLNSLDNIVTKDPGAIGLVGQVRGLGQDVMATGREAASVLQPFAPQAAQMIKQVESGALPREMSQYFNPNIPQATLLENTILAQYAKMQDPNGRLSNQQMEIAAKALGINGMLKSADKTKAVIAGIRQQIAQKRAMIGASVPAANAIRPPDAAGGPAPAAPTGAPVRRRWNAETGALE